MFEIFLILTLFSLALGQECADFENSGFFCVDSRLCIEGNIDQSGQNVLSVRQAEEPSLPSPETRSQALRSSCREVSETCCYYGEGLGLQNFKTEQPASRSSCGQHNEGGVEGFVSNKRKKLGFGEFPHICVILSRLIVDGKRKKQYEGAASLISPRVLLTAAHIVDDFGDDELEIRCGEWDSSTRDEPLQYQTRAPEKVLIYPEANSENLHNDFALIFVNEEFSISQHISPVCLPEPELDVGSEEYEFCIGSGWGRIDTNQSLEMVLKKVEQPLVDFSTCESKLRQSALSKFFILDPSFICAGGKAGEDLCEGDGGAPLTCKGQDGLLYQLGITAWGLECNKAYPSVYSSVPYAGCWIDQQVTCELGAGEDGVSYFGFKSCPPISC